MKTRSGRIKYGFLGSRSGLVRKTAVAPTEDVFVTLVEDVRLDKSLTPITTHAAHPCAWIVTRESAHTRVYATTREGHMDWRVVPWDESERGVDVAWVLRARKRAFVVHFSRLDITVARAASALRRSILFCGGDVVFDHQTATLDTTTPDGKNTAWGRRALIRDAVPKTDEARIFLPCSFC